MASYIGRRRFLATLLGGAAAAWPFAAHAQHTRAADAIPRIAFLTLGLQENYPAFVDGLRRLGYAQGRNLDIDYRYGPVEKLEPLARELIALKPDILVASAPSAAIAFKGVAPMLPIVCLGLTDAGIPHLFASYARPGGPQRDEDYSDRHDHARRPSCIGIRKQHRQARSKYHRNMAPSRQCAGREGTGFSQDGGAWCRARRSPVQS
jgi:hypothetical protein